MKRFLRLLMISSVILVSSLNALSQLPMTRSIFSAPYTPITAAGGASTATAAQADGAVATALPIGFSFNYLGTNYSTFTVSSDGWMSFTATANSAANNNLYTTTAPNATLAPWFDDLFTNSLLYQTSGTPGSQILTVQWSSFSYWNVTNIINFQVKLYEGTNQIEFLYDAQPTGTISTSESASIGIEGITGGNGQYLDAVTGSAFTSNAALQSTRFPGYNFRFTPGAPTQLAGGTYNVGVGQTFINLNEAVAEINHKGISGPIVLNLTDANYDVTPANGDHFFPILLGPISGNNSTNTINISKQGTPATISYAGTGSGAYANQASTTAISGTTAEPIIGLVGADYVTISNLNINGAITGSTSDAGIGIYNSSATDGATNNTIQNVSVQMQRSNTSSRGFLSNVVTTPTSAAGANSNNTFRDFSIKNVYAGIQLAGNATFPDLNTIVTSTNCNLFNTIGDPLTVNDIGNGTTATYGISATNLSGFTISRNSINNVTNTGGQADGIIIATYQGTSSLNNNRIQGIRNAGAASTTAASGMRLSHTTTGTHTLRVFNNIVSNITSGYTGTASATRTLKGIFVSGTGGGTTQTYEIYNNSVSIDGSSSLNLSSVCFEISTASGPVYKLGNNIFANYTSAQTGVARHLGLFSTSATAFGGTGSLSTNNNIFVQNDLGTTGFTGIGNLTNYTLLTDWQAAYVGFEASSVALNPNFLSNVNDLRVGNIALNNVGAALQAYITNDNECVARTDNDLGAYVINACSGSPNPTEALATTATSVCPNSSVNIGATGLSTEAGIVHQWQVSTVSGGPYTNVSSGTGANSANYNTGNLVSPGTYYYILSSTCTASGLTAFSNEVSVIVFAPPAVTITPSNGGNFCGQGTLTASGALTYTWSPALFLESTTGSTVTSTTTTNSTFSVIGVDANGCSNNASVNITYTAPPAVTITATNPSFCGAGGVSTLTANSATAYNYTWQALDGATLSTTTGNTTDATISQTSAFKLTAIETSTACVNVQYYSIGVYPLPTATVTTTANGVCPGTSATINSGLSAGNFTVSSVPYVAKNAPITATTIATNGQALVPLSGGSLDDGGWSNIPIGFNFNFFGNSFSTISAGTNGLLMFGTPPGYGTGAGQLGQFNFNTTGGVFPNANNPGNVIALMAADQYFGNLSQTAGGSSSTIKYWTEGYAPNRIFVIEYSDVDPCCSNGPTGFTAQARLYETIGVVDIAVVSKTATNSPTIGLQDATKTIGAVAPGRQAFSSLITTPETWRFSPPSNYTTVWTANGAPLPAPAVSSGTNIFSQSVSPLVTTTYSISYTNQTTGCQNAPGSAEVVMSVLGQVAPSNVTAQSSVGTACSGVTFNLSTNYTGSSDGLTYQWQVSADNGTTWTDITGANGLTYTTSLTAASSYRIGISSCGGTIEYSSVASVALSAPTDCYCTPTYSSGTSDGDLISNVTIVGTTLSNNTGSTQGGPSYTFYTGQPNYTATLLPSTSYSVNVSVGTWGNQHIRAWIDYNDDGVFSNTESIGSAVIAPGQSNSGPFPPASFTVALACTPPAGVHRLRIRSVWSTTANFNTTIDPCSNQGFGETEDYLITIAPAPTCPAPGAMTATTTSTTAPLSWNMGCSVATNFDFEYGPVGFTQGTGTALNDQIATISGTTGTYTLTGLTPNTQYSVYYRANCGNGDVSPWSVATNFTTLCAPISLNNPGNAVACDSYTLPALTEFTPSNNTGLTLSYFNGPNGTAGQITGPITTTKTVYANGRAGSCSTDSVFTVTIYNTPTLTVLNPTICLGDSTVLWSTQGNAIDFVYTLNNNFIGSGVAYHVTPASTTTYGISAVGLGGCISAEQQATVTVNQPTTSTSTATSCDSYAWNGQTYTQSGTYTFTTTNAAGCDSVATLNLTINNSTTGSETITACDSLVWNGQTYTQSGTYTYLTTNAVGCDSTVTLNLTINNSTTSSTNVTACVSYQWNGQTYTQSGVYTFTTTNAVGCDSVATLNLTINNALFTTETVSACVTYDWNGQTYTQSGTYTFLTTSVNGCDSTVTLNLTINQPSSSTTTQTSCDSYTWNGQTYTQSGTYVFNTTTVAGCDSTATLELTINNSSTSSTSQTACDSYSWNGQTYTQSGTYTYTTTNAVGCDSVATLVLTINNSTTSSTTQAACDSYTWNGQTYTQSGSYTYTTTNAAGCDSTATLILTINQSPSATATDNGDGTGTASAGATYQWIDCATNTAIAGATQQTFAPSVTGQYSVVVTNASGCSDTSACITIDVSKLNELSSLNIQVNPNPSNGVFNLTMNTSVNGQIIVTDATGRIIATQSMNGTSSSIDLTNSVTGIYYFTVQFNDSEKVIRVIKN